MPNSGIENLQTVSWSMRWVWNGEDIRWACRIQTRLSHSVVHFGFYNSNINLLSIGMYVIVD